MEAQILMSNYDMIVVVPLLQPIHIVFLIDKMLLFRRALPLHRFGISLLLLDTIGSNNVKIWSPMISGVVPLLKDDIIICTCTGITGIAVLNLPFDFGTINYQISNNRRQ